MNVFVTNMAATNLNFCPNLNPTHDFDEETLLGMWFIHEYIYHKDETVRTDVNPYCPIVQIRKLEDFMNGGLINRNLVRHFFNLFFYLASL